MLVAREQKEAICEVDEEVNFLVCRAASCLARSVTALVVDYLIIFS